MGEESTKRLDNLAQAISELAGAIRDLNRKESLQQQI